MLLHLQLIWVQLLDVVRVPKNESFLAIEAKSDNIFDVFDGHSLGLVKREFLLEDVLLIVGDLDHKGNVEHVLEVLGEDEWNGVAHMHGFSGWASASV